MSDQLQKLKRTLEQGGDFAEVQIRFTYAELMSLISLIEEQASEISRLKTPRLIKP